MTERPKGFSMEEADNICEEHVLSPEVSNAYPVTFADVTHVHLGLINGDIVVFGPDESFHIEI